MLKVVGASWLQTRISTYILVAVALLGIGAIILGEFGHVEKDGTYSATVSWNHKGGYRIDFWGQGNDLTAVPLNAARAYYKTGIFESGWSIVEIETSAKYPDTVQAYAAGLLEGSLTWQLIHHHWYNSVGKICEKKVLECEKLKRYLRENMVVMRERAELLEATDPFWHMVRLSYAQLDGLEAGWRFAVRRSRQTVEMTSEDFLWLAMASDLSSLEQIMNISDSQIGSKGMIFLKALPRERSEPLIAIGHNTATSYRKMLRLIKKYTFGYHLLPGQKGAALVPGRTIAMSSYPGALSSYDELYLIYGENRELIVTGTPLSMTNRSLWNFINPKNQVMASISIMAANHLATNSQTWSRILGLQNSGTSIRQWITYEPRSSIVWLVEQFSVITQAADYTEQLKDFGFISCTGIPQFREIKEIIGVKKEDSFLRRNYISQIQENITTLEDVRNVMRGYSHEGSTAENINTNVTENLLQVLTYRGDLEAIPMPRGVIDTKILAVDVDGIITFEATSGPVITQNKTPFTWSNSFPNISHIGQPDVFNFESITPLWAWI